MHLMYWYSSFVFCVVLISPYMLNKPLVKVFHTSYDCHRFKLLCIFSFRPLCVTFCASPDLFTVCSHALILHTFFYFSSDYFLCLSVSCFVTISYVMISLDRLFSLRFNSRRLLILLLWVRSCTDPFTIGHSFVWTAVTLFVWWSEGHLICKKFALIICRG